MIASTAKPSRFTPAAPAYSRKRILVSAYAVSPVRGSEPGVGWQICSRLAKYHDVTVLCAPGVPGPDATYFRDEIAEYTAKFGEVPGLTLRFVEPSLFSFLFQRETPLCRRTVYYAGAAAWQRRALKVARQLHRDAPFDLVHHLNITGYREPGYLWQLGVPFFWGPIGGAPSFPPAYFDLLSRKDRFFYSIRNWMNERQKRAARCRATAAAAKHIWAISSEDARLVEQIWRRPAEQMLETGAVLREQGHLRDYDGTRPLRVVWSGQHFGRKALPILLHALAELKNQPPIDLTVVGDGPATVQWQSLAKSLKLNRIAWTGRVPHERALAEVAAGDVLAFTSVLEGTPHVVLEALSLGLPVVCHNACGMGMAVTDNCGIRVDMVDSATSIGGFAAALRTLASDANHVRRLSQGALDRAAELSWDSKVERIVEAYDRVLKPVAHSGV